LYRRERGEYAEGAEVRMLCVLCEISVPSAILPS
jgi:hypothetical protein